MSKRNADADLQCFVGFLKQEEIFYRQLILQSNVWIERFGKK